MEKERERETAGSETPKKVEPASIDRWDRSKRLVRRFYYSSSTPPRLSRVLNFGAVASPAGQPRLPFIRWQAGRQGPQGSLAHAHTRTWEMMIDGWSRPGVAWLAWRC